MATAISQLQSEAETSPPASPLGHPTGFWRVRYHLRGCARLVRDFLADLERGHVSYLLVEILIIANAVCRARGIEPPPDIPRTLRTIGDARLLGRWLLRTLKAIDRTDEGPYLKAVPGRSRRAQRTRFWFATETA